MSLQEPSRNELLKILSSLKVFFESQKRSGINVYMQKENVPGDVCDVPLRTDKELKNSIPRDNDLRLHDIQEVIGECTRCKLHKTRNKIVFGEGNPDARLLFIGEAPGADEDVQGRPFVGKAGQLLTRIIQAINLKRNDVYIANIVKCRPPKNRNPDDDEIQTCFPFLLKQLHVIQPQIICTLGRIATSAVLKTEGGITELRGKFYHFNGIKVMPTYHPSYLLRNQEKKKETWIDMQMVQKEYFRDVPR